jgi:hypothetical protein
VTIIVAQSNYHATLRLYIVPTAILDNGSILASLYYANSGTKRPWRSLLHVTASNEPQAPSTAITCAQQLLHQEQFQQRQLQQQQQQQPSEAPVGSVVSDVADDDCDFESIRTSAQHTSTVTDDIA